MGSDTSESKIRLAEAGLEIIAIGLGILVSLVGYANFYSFTVVCGSQFCLREYYWYYRIALFGGAIMAALGTIGLTRNFVSHMHPKLSND